MSTATLTAEHAPDIVTQKPRISSIDIVRGAVMVVMALDHVRDFFHEGALQSNPTDMETTWPALFFTRWITHFCAPTFVFLAGTSIYLAARRKPKNELSLFLLTRGLWLILLEVVVIRFGLFFNFYYDVTVFQVIWVIGAAMICLAGLIHFPYRVILGLGLLIVFCHNIADLFPALTEEEPLFTVWTFLKQTGFVNVTDRNGILVFYPLLPWVGIMALGYCLGKLYGGEFTAAQRRKLLFSLGAGAVALFVVLRLINGYGDPAPWSVQKSGIFTFMSFLNTTKYGPSLLYTLMTLGPVLILLSALEKVRSGVLDPLAVFGRVPLFYYILHFFLIHATALLFFMNKTGSSFSELDFHFDKSFGGLTAEAGYALGWAYVVWISVVLVLYPLCKKYNRYKSTHNQWWLSYL